MAIELQLKASSERAGRLGREADCYTGATGFEARN